MPNTEVKLTNAESTWPEAAREDRKLLIKEKTLTNVGVFFHMPGLPICMHKFEGSRTKVSGRIRERCHPSNRFFTPCYVAASLLSHTAFLPPFRMTIEGESFIMRGTLSVIMRKTIIPGRQPTIFNIRYLCFYFLENFCLLTAAAHL